MAHNSSEPLTELLDLIYAGDANGVERQWGILVKNMSYYDVALKGSQKKQDRKEREQLYHVMIACACFAARDKYDYRSNREAGDGRYDLVFTRLGATPSRVALLEFDIPKAKEELSRAHANRALEQIVGKQYLLDVMQPFSRTERFQQVVLVGMAFQGKRVKVQINERVWSEEAKDYVDLSIESTESDGPSFKKRRR